MLLRERYFDDDGKLIVEQTHDNDVYIERARLAREAGRAPMSDSWHVGSVPAYLVAEWCKEAGVSLDDTDAVNDILFKKLNSGEFNAFRVKKGRV